MFDVGCCRTDAFEPLDCLPPAPRHFSLSLGGTNSIFAPVKAWPPNPTGLIISATPPQSGFKGTRAAAMARERRRSKRSLSGDGDKSFRICSVLGGLDVTRYVSRDARSFFAGALDDVELIREIITETALNGGVGHRLTLTELNNTLDRVGRGYDSNETIQTTVEVSTVWRTSLFLHVDFADIFSTAIRRLD